MTEAWGTGHVVAGKYRLVEKLGEGGMGAVWRAEHLTLGSAVAIKLVSQEVLDSGDGVKRFLNEARAAALLRSPHVVQILDHGVDEDVPFMVMELLEGESLADRLTRAGALSLAETSRIVTQVARAMTRAHEAGITHRDLKPDNIFLVRNEDEELAKVLDFGIAKVAHGVALEAHALSTQTGALLGTPYYMSPEQVRGQPVDWRTDLWALGVVAYECAVGRVPFAGHTIGDLLLNVCTEEVPRPSAHATVPPSFDAWFLRAVARPREDRFQSAREMADALRALVADAPAASEQIPRATVSLSPSAAPHADTIAAPLTPDPAARSEEQAQAPSPVVASPGPRASRGGLAVVAAVLLGGAGLAVWLATSRPSATMGGPESAPRTTSIATAAPTAAPGVTSAARVTEIPTVTPEASAPAPSARPPASATRPPARVVTAKAPSDGAKPKVTAEPTASAPPPPPPKDPLAF